MKRKPYSRRKRITTKSVLRLPDLEHAKAAVLNSLTSLDAQRGYRHAIDEFVDWHCSEPRLALNRIVVLEVMQLVMVTQYFDTLKSIGENDKTNTLFLSHSPASVKDVSDVDSSGVETWGRTLLLMLRWHTVLPTSSQRTRANEVGAEVLLAISREFGKSLEWLLTGEE